MIPLRQTRRLVRRLLAGVPLLPVRHAPRKAKVGLPPGSLVYTGRHRDQPSRVSVLTYDGERLEETGVATAPEAMGKRVRPGVTWINVTGLQELSLIQELGEHFRIDPLLLEDVLHVGQRPKMQVGEDYIFVVLRMFTLEPETERIRHEQVSMVLGGDFLLTFQESEGDVFDPVRTRLREARGRIRDKGADYLAYALIDTIVDNYFVVLERLSDRVEEIEAIVLEGEAHQPELVGLIHRLRRENIVLRKAVWPVRELVGDLSREEGVGLITEDTRPYLRDVQDHAMEVIDTVETLRDMIGGLLDIHLSMVSNRMNEVMKVLTIIATIFVPLTFLVGVYGMNFEYMPELRVWWAYPALWIIMLGIMAGMMGFFRRRGWL